MYSYLDWVETADSLSVSSSFSLDTTYGYGGESLLHVAAKSGHVSMVKLLLDKGATINIQDESGNTALHYASANGKKDMVKLLLEKGADASVVNAKEQKAIDYSNIKGYNEITELLLKFSPSNTVNPAVAKTETVVPPADMSSKKQALLDLKELLDAGILSQEEFDQEKSKILKG
jgi:ankyrin repeat protein